MRIQSKNGLIDLDALNARPAGGRGPVCAVYSDYTWNSRSEQTSMPSDHEGPVGVLTDDGALVLYSDLALKCALDLCVSENAAAVKFLMQEFARAQSEGAWDLESVPDWSPLKQFLTGLGAANVLLPPSNKILAGNLAALREISVDEDLAHDCRWGVIGDYIYLGGTRHSFEMLVRSLCGLFRTLSCEDLKIFLDRYYGHDMAGFSEPEAQPAFGLAPVSYIQPDEPSVHELDEDYILGSVPDLSNDPGADHGDPYVVSDEDMNVPHGSDTSGVPESENVDAPEVGDAADGVPDIPDLGEDEPVSPDDAGDVSAVSDDEDVAAVSPDEAGDVPAVSDDEDGEAVSPDEASDVPAVSDDEDGEAVSPDEASDVPAVSDDEDGEAVSPDEAGDVPAVSDDEDGEAVSPDEAGDVITVPDDDDGEPVSPDEAGAMDAVQDDENSSLTDAVSDKADAAGTGDENAEDTDTVSDGGDASGDGSGDAGTETPDGGEAGPGTDDGGKAVAEKPAEPETPPEPPMPTVEDMLKQSRLKTVSAGDILGRDTTYAAGYFEDAYDRELEKADSDGFLDEMLASRVNGTAAPIDLMSETLAAQRERKIQDLSGALDRAQHHDPTQATTQLGRKMSELREQLQEESGLND